MTANLSPKLGDDILLSKPLYSLTVGEFFNLFKDSFPAPSVPLATNQDKPKRFIDELAARQRLSGSDENPISRPTLNKLRRQGHITTFFPSPGRIAFDPDQIDNHIAKHGKEGAFLTKYKK